MNKGKKMRRNLMIAVIIMFIAIGFALLSTDLDIIGNYSIRSVKWDIHFENASTTSGSVSGEPSIIDDDTTVSYTFTFNNPTDYYEFTVDAVNDGSMDAIITEVDNGIYDSTGENRIEMPDFLEYSVINTTTNEKLKVGQTLNKNTTNVYKVKVNMRDNLGDNEIPRSYTGITFKLNVNYAQKKKNSESSYMYYNGYANLGDAKDSLWEYSIISVQDKTASITGFNQNYNKNNPESYDCDVPEAFVSYCSYCDSNYCDISSHNNIKELEKIVFPAKVKLDSEGNLSNSGDEYTITSVDISNGEYYYVDRGIQEMIFPNTVTSITLSNYYKYLETVRLPNSLTTLPHFQFEYDYDNSGYHVINELRIPSNITTLSDDNNFNLYDHSYYCDYDGDNYHTYGETEDGAIIYIPKEVNSIGNYAFIYPNLKKIYVESKEVKTKVITAITNYCNSEYNYYYDCYEDANSCISDLSKRVIYDPTQF